jgi:hypothetical protein
LLFGSRSYALVSPGGANKAHVPSGRRTDRPLRLWEDGTVEALIGIAFGAGLAWLAAAY